MTKGRIFLLAEGDELREMIEETYVSEADLQRLLARYPNLLPGDQMNEESPRRWLLVSREVAVPDREEGAGRWSLDHLFLDQDGVPTLVEVKRSSDTRIRREVLGQMLDYAANGIAFWPVEALRALFEADYQAQDVSSDARLREFLGDGALDVEGFWQQVKTNLQAGRIRMVFVADEIPAELRRVVEFLNRQMAPAEVLAVAVRQYVREGLRTLVPQVLGQTAEAQTRKAGRPRRQWDEKSFFAALDEAGDAASIAGARRVYRWAQEHLPRLDWGRGLWTGSCIPVRDLDGVTHYPIVLRTNGVLEVCFNYLSRKPPFDDEARRQELLERLNQVPGVRLPPDSHNRAPNFPFAVLANDASWVAFEGVLRWYLAQIGAEPATAAGSGEAEGSTSIRAARGMLRGIDTTVERDDDRV
jgi:hypothetical protein